MMWLILSILLSLISHNNAKNAKDSILPRDRLWLRYDPIPDPSPYINLKSVTIQATTAICNDTIQRAALHGIADELSTGLSGLLGRQISNQITCYKHHSYNAVQNTSNTFVVSIANTNAQTEEGFTITTLPQYSIVANTPSGGLYGTFRFLSFLQQHKKIPTNFISSPAMKTIPTNFTSSPAMKIRAWDLWDTVSGVVEQGHDGNSLIWPYAIYSKAKPPPQNKVFLAAICNSSDPFQQWESITFRNEGVLLPGTIRNVGSNTCLTSMNCNPVSVGACTGPSSASWIYNKTNQTLALVDSGSSAGCSKAAGGCLDLNRGTGPNLDIWSCHAPFTKDYLNQQFIYNTTSHAIQPKNSNKCLTLSRSAPLPDATTNNVDPWDPNSEAFYLHRVHDLLRFLKSSGINTLVLNDVNACGDIEHLLGSSYLTNWTSNLRPLFERYAITPMLSLCFAAPTEMSNITSDPLNPLTIKWWEEKFLEIYTKLPTFGGVVVKADSEGNVGPMSFNRTEADGANMLARLLKKHGANNYVLWRAFLYGDGLGVDPNKMDKIGQEDLARQAYDTFKPLDGTFDDNVILQIKNGPMDFQVREPPHPLLGGMPKSNVMMEVSANQGYTGHQIHVVNLAEQWKTYLNWDTQWGRDGKGGKLTIANILTGKKNGGISTYGGGMACTSNIGNFRNYTGHVLAASNTYACGRLAWNPTLTAKEVDEEWALMTFPSSFKSNVKSNNTSNNIQTNPVVDVVIDILQKSWLTYEGYSSPMGIGFIIGQDNPYGCAPKTNRSKGGGEGPGGIVCPTYTSHDWPTCKF